MFVSHDRYFIKQIATGILDFTADEVRQYNCGYDEYLEEKRKRQAGIITDLVKDAEQKRETEKKSQADSPTLDDVFDKKTYYNPGKIKSRLEKQLEKYEKMIEESEEKANNLKLELANPDYANDYVKLMELQNELDAQEHNIDNLLERMVEAETELEELEEKTYFERK